MRYLRELFNEELDAEGIIEIAGQTFERHLILSGMAEDAYETVFADWVRIRREGMMDKARKTLEMYDNEDRFEQLKRSLGTGSVWPFVGAGLSSSTGYPLWTRFLYALCENSHITSGTLSGLLDDGKYEEAAQLLHDDLGPALFNERVEGTYNRDRAIVGPVNYLPSIFGNSSVLTTNFDPVLEVVFSQGECAGFDRVISGKEVDEVLRVISSGSRVLVKLHGSCENVSGRVLLKSEYEEAYGNDGRIAEFFRRVLFGRSLLFLGCHLTFDRTIQYMCKQTETEGPSRLPRHYAFLELKDPGNRIDRQKELAHANIFPIWYPADDHDESIEALLIALAEE